MNHSHSNHFEGKNPYEHVLQKKSEMASEIHGDELPGHYGSFLDAARDISILLLILCSIVFVLQIPTNISLILLILLPITWMVWKTVRSSWLSWSILERLHRVSKEEQYEIEHHREQEREELTALYAAKGFRGDLLKEVIDVLMADDERLLKVMMEEEMGLSLEHYEHPLKIGIFAALGAIITGVLLIGAYLFLPYYSPIIVAIIFTSISGMLMAKLQKNDLLSAFIWNGGAAILIGAIAYFGALWLKVVWG